MMDQKNLGDARSAAMRAVDELLLCVQDATGGTAAVPARILRLAAQGLADEAMSAQSRTAVKALGEEAKALGFLGESILLGGHLGSLADYLNHRWKELPKEDGPPQDATLPGVPTPARSTVGRDLGL